jgi:hypothetical protein
MQLCPSVLLSFQIPFTFDYHAVSFDIGGIRRRRAGLVEYLVYEQHCSA